MVSNQQIARLRFYLNAAVLLTMLVSVFCIPAPVLADDAPESVLPDFYSFTQSVASGETNILRGVYVPGVLALPIIQQPLGNPGFVSTTDSLVTQFSMAAEVGNVGLLAHNYLAGRLFPMLAPGQEVRLVYGDGKVERFIVDQVLHYQALEPYNPYGKFKNTKTGSTITAEELFRLVYRGERHVTFQTCIDANGNLSWGRLFVLAIPLTGLQEDYVSYSFEHRFR